MKFKLIPIMVLAASTMFATSMPAGHATADAKGRLDVWNSGVAPQAEVSHAAPTASVNPVQRDGKGRLSIYMREPAPEAYRQAAPSQPAPAHGLHFDAKGRLSEWNKV